MGGEWNRVRLGLWECVWDMFVKSNFGSDVEDALESMVNVSKEVKAMCLSVDLSKK